MLPASEYSKTVKWLFDIPVQQGFQPQAIERVFRNNIRYFVLQCPFGRLQNMPTMGDVSCIPKEAVNGPGVESRRRMSDDPSIYSYIHPTIS
jgi:hypothetical protein